jgi:GNAT superfamily N-acetyltransferase
VSDDIQRYLRAVAADGRQLFCTGPFDVFLDSDSDHPYSNYAIPRDGAKPDLASIQELITVMQGSARTPRLEFLPRVAPDVEAALVDAGFEVELRTPLMTCARDDLAEYSTPENVTVQIIGPEAEREQVLGLLKALALAFDDVFDASTADSTTARLLRRVAVIAYADGEIAGGGMCLDPIESVVELVGIGVTDSFRRRGIAAAITGALTEAAFANGATRAFLTPGAESTARIYERAGFERTDEMLHLRFHD